MNQLTRDHARPGATAANQQNNTQHPTSNVQRRAGRSAVLLWELVVGGWRLDVLP